MVNLSSLSDEELKKLYNSEKNAQKKVTPKMEMEQKTKKEAYLSQLSDEELKNLYNSYKSSGNDQLSNTVSKEEHPTLNAIKDFLKGAAQENIDLGTGLYNLGSRGATAILRSQGLNFPQQKPVHYNIMGDITHPTAANLGRISGVLASAFTPAGAVSKVPLVGKGVAKLLELTQLKPIQNVSRGTLSALERKNLNNWLTRTLLNAGEGAASGATYGAMLGANKANSNLAEEAKSGALFGAGFGAALPQPGEIGAALKNKKINALIKEATSGASNMKTPAEAAKDLNMAENLPIDLGSFIGNPHLAKEFEVRYGRTPEGQRSAAEPLKDLRERASNFMENLGGIYQSNPADIIKDLKNHMRGQLKIHEKNVSNAFENVINEAEKGKITTNNNPKFTALSKKLLADDQRLASEDRTPLLRGAADLKEIFERGAKDYQGVKERSLYGLDQERKVLGTLKKKYKKLDNQLLATMAERGEKSIQEDIEDILKSKGRGDLADQWKDARRLFATKVTAYRPKRIKNMLEGITNPDNLIDVLTHPQHKEIYEDLSPDLRRGIIYRHLLNKTGEEFNDKGIRKIDPTTLIRNYEKLVNKTDASRLFSQKELSELDNIKQLNRMLETAKNIEKPPRTGFYAALENNKLGDAMHKYGIPALTAALGYGGHVLGQSLPVLLAEVLGSAGVGLAGKKINKMKKEKLAKFLTSPEAKRAFAKGEKIRPSSQSLSKANRGTERLLNEFLSRNKD